MLLFFQIDFCLNLEHRLSDIKGRQWRAVYLVEHKYTYDENLVEEGKKRKEQKKKKKKKKKKPKTKQEVFRERRHLHICDL